MLSGERDISPDTIKNSTIELKNVSFKYPNSDSLPLENISLKLEPKKRIAIVGMNSSGKTIFIKLLCRLYDPTEGEILVDGVNIMKYNHEEYLKAFSVVFQDFYILPFMLGENVAASNVYDGDAVINVLKKTGVKYQNPEIYLYKTFDESCVEISGGEAQKIALARALYKDAPVLVLDEPTASLDPRAEYEIYTKFNEISQDKTVIFISHRLASCRFCDDILVFDKGRIVQRGKHEDLLMDEQGKYYELWHAQAQYYN